MFQAIAIHHARSERPDELMLLEDA